MYAIRSYYAARRAGVRTILLPERNRESLQEIDEHILEDVKILFVDSLAEIVKVALVEKGGVSDAGYKAPPAGGNFAAGH